MVSGYGAPQGKKTHICFIHFKEVLASALQADHGLNANISSMAPVAIGLYVNRPIARSIPALVFLQAVVCLQSRSKNLLETKVLECHGQIREAD
jgi:hypothetical protein